MSSRPTRHLARILGAGLLALGVSACQVPYGSTTTADQYARKVSLPTTTTAPARTTTAPAPTTAPSPPGWRLVGGDEFDATTLNASNWVAYHNTYGDGNNELACLTPGNVSDSDGALHLSARRQTVACPGGTTEQYTSGFVSSREVGRLFPRYGRYEVRARLPHTQGMWPAFWLRHANGSSTAEVDIMEYFHSQVPGKTTQTLHLNGVSNVAKRSAFFEAPTLNPGWHTWAVDILPDPAGVRFTMYLDGVSMMTYVDTNHAWTSADPNRTWDIALNLAVGGKWTGQPDDTLGYLRDLNRCAQSGIAPGGCSTTGIRRVDWANPATNTYDIDYVRVYVPA